MDKIIKKQLELINTPITKVSDDGLEYYFSKQVDTSLQPNKNYFIEIVDNSIFDSNNTVNMNFNSGIIPPSKFLKIQVVLIISKLIKVDAIETNSTGEHDTMRFWSGYLPVNGIKVLEELKD